MVKTKAVKVGIVGLGRWAKVLTRTCANSQEIEIVAGYSRSEEKRQAFEQQLGVPSVPDMKAMLSNPEIAGVILTVPNEQHLPVGAQVAKARKHVYTEKPIDSGELGRIAFMEANFSNERALELTPKAWRWYKDKAPGGPLSQLAIHQFDVLHYLGGEVVEASAMAAKLSPVGAEVDDQSMTLLKFADGKVGYVGSCWTSPGVFSVRVFGSKGLMHYEIDFNTWDTPGQLHKNATLYIQRGKDGYAKREELQIPESDMFRTELEMFANSCRTGKPGELSAYNGNVAVAIVYATLRSIETNGQYTRIADVLREAQARVAERVHDVA